MRYLMLQPLFAPVATALFFGILCGVYLPQGHNAIFHLTQGVWEHITAIAYAVPFVVLVFCFKSFKGHFETLFLTFFLFVCAGFREAGIQHWLTSTDSTAFKLRFFTNPSNPLDEKISAALLLLIVGGVVALLLIRYTPKIIKGFFQLNPFYWTICTLGATGIVGKIADRLPANWRQSNGDMPPDLIACFTLFEEVLETCLPLLFAVALFQFHLMKRQRPKEQPR